MEKSNTSRKKPYKVMKDRLAFSSLSGIGSYLVCMAVALLITFGIPSYREHNPLAVPAAFANISTHTDKAVLIINSFPSIKKYGEIQKYYSDNVKYKLVTVDLNNRSIDENKISRIIKDTKPDLIYCIGSKAYKLVYEHAENIPVMFTSILNWNRFPMDDNTYGISNEVPPSSQLNMFRYFFPKTKKIGILYNETYNKKWIKQAVQSSKNVDISIVAHKISSNKDLKKYLRRILKKVDALWLIPDPTVIKNIDSINLIFREADKKKVPIFAYDKSYKADGATFIISADNATTGRQAAKLTKDIFKKKHFNNKIKNPAGTFIIINQRNISKYGMELNEEALDSVREIID